ncbi:MAG: NADH:ubiquinone reductase (Na(+)-transporting) subunit A [Aquincola sp.]|nr:NADH:ubiquinone reductase (Na(+)-transporting) subunit A [Aquincola sp.]
MRAESSTHTRQFRLRRGLDLNLAGAPGLDIGAAPAVGTVALPGIDLAGLRPALRVAVGDRVTLGQVLAHDRHDPDLVFTSPGTGTVTAIHYGDRRALLALVIALTDETTGLELADPLDPASVAAADVRRRLLAAGLWPAFRTRPFSRIPGSTEQADAIFVTGLDTAPLAGDPRVAIDRDPAAFRTGITALTRLTAGPVYVCRAPGDPLPLPDAPRIVDAVFSGPHPAGLPGTHIHHLHPVGSRPGTGRAVWYLAGQDVIAIGRLLASGRLDQRRIIALSGAVDRPRLIETRVGACVADLTGTPAAGLRVLAGDPLTGRDITAETGWLGRLEWQVTLLREAPPAPAFGWVRAALGALAPGIGLPPATTRVHGRPTGMLPVDTFERVLPLDLLPSPLLRALLLRDTDTAVELGCLELAAEDLALCSYVCPARHDYGAALRATLDDYRQNG